MLKITNNRNTFYQWDIGQSLTVESVAGQTISEVHIGTCASNLYVVEPVNGIVAVYDELLQTGDDIIAYEFIRNNSTSAYTTKKYKFPVVNRPKATDYAYTPTTSYSWEYWCERARLYSVAAASSVDSIPATMTAWWTAHKDDFKGEDGISPTASVSKVGTKSTITITDANGTTTAEVNDGASGSSAHARVEQTTTGAVIYCTDEDGTTTATIRNGTDGQTQDLTDYVKNTDYANSTKGGVMKVNAYYDTQISNGTLLGVSRDYNVYSAKPNEVFISKGTLENVLANRLAEPQFELIEDITLSEDTASITRSTEPNGNSYNFKHLICHIASPIGTTQNSVTFLVNERWMGAILNPVHASSQKKSMLDAEVIGGRLFAQNTYSAGGDYDTNLYLGSRNINSCGRFEASAITSLRFINCTFPSGTNIKIYGIRG